MSADTMSPETQLVYESRVRTRQMIVAIAAGLLLMAATVTTLVGPHAKVNELTLGLITDHKRGSLDLISAIVNAIAQAAIAWTLVFLFRCARARSERVLPIAPILAIVGATMAGVAGLINSIVIMGKVHTFVTTGMQTYDEADRLTSGSGLLILQIIEQLSALVVAVAFVLVALQAMRVGLLPKFLGYIGMVAGALVLFPIIAVPIVQLYFLVCVGLLTAGIWPNGPPRAWVTGRAEAWASSAETRARRMAEAEEARGQRPTRRSRRGTMPVIENTGATEASEAAETESTPTPARPRSSSPQRRKRKHRR